MAQFLYCTHAYLRKYSNTSYKKKNVELLKKFCDQNTMAVCDCNNNNTAPYFKRRLRLNKATKY